MGINGITSGACHVMAGMGSRGMVSFLLHEASVRDIGKIQRNKYLWGCDLIMGASWR
jgi:hypothetical protein